MLCISLMLIVAMARSIKLFQSTQKWYDWFGIYPTQSNENRLFNLRNGVFIFTLAQMGTLTGIFFVFQAKRFDVFCSGFERSATIVVQSLYFIIIIFQMGNILKFIEKFEELIAESE